jgi:hypothetical protein
MLCNFLVGIVSLVFYVIGGLIRNTIGLVLYLLGAPLIWAIVLLAAAAWYFGLFDTAAAAEKPTYRAAIEQCQKDEAILAAHVREAGADFERIGAGNPGSGPATSQLMSALKRKLDFGNWADCLKRSNTPP